MKQPTRVGRMPAPLGSPIEADSCVIIAPPCRPRPEVNPQMNIQDRSNTFDLNKYGVGQPVPRTEDPVLVQGHGRYTDDLTMAGQAYAVFVRSRNGHGTIKGIDTAAAKAM